jgi:hypothetical protein
LRRLREDKEGFRDTEGQMLVRGKKEAPMGRRDRVKRARRKARRKERRGRHRG